MKLSTSIVSVKRINSSLPRSEFSEERIEEAAQAILAAEGLINPLILRRTSLESYQVVEGDFEYYAAVRAKEINLLKGETIGAFIIEPEKEEVLQQQIALFRQTQKTTVILETDSSSSNQEIRITNVESRLDNRFNELKQEQEKIRQELTQRINKLEESIPKKQEPLDSLNSLSEAELSFELERRSRVSAPKKKAKAIVEARNKKKKQNSKFKDYADVVKSVKGIGDKTMLTIIDAWS